jgi:hypothetical protein
MMPWCEFHVIRRVGFRGRAGRLGFRIEAWDSEVVKTLSKDCEISAEKPPPCLADPALKSRQGTPLFLPGQTDGQSIKPAKAKVNSHVFLDLVGHFF